MEVSLKTRHQEILTAIVREYIETGEPVGSRTLSRHRAQPLSAASIRNVMADLADEGYLSQPHTSAGRVPTEKAFRFYVRSLGAARMTAVDASRVSSQFSGLNSVGAHVERSSQILTELTRNVGIAAAIPALSQELEQIELIPLAAQRVLMVLVTRDHMVRNRVLALDEPISPTELVSIRNYINRHFAGWRLGDARRELVRRMLEERELYQAELRRMQTLWQRGLLEFDIGPEVHLDGVSNLLGIDLHLTREKMRELLRALEEKQRLIELLDRFLEQPPGELEVHVNLEEAHPAMRDLALIGMTVRLRTGLPAKVAVLGPMRMHYEKVMAAVLQTSRALESAEL
ncbi:MAG TPA: heat-inducible transcriptional repressor HrcA [Bryobacteraceae bacterium]|nr:heat-inducible transcriptional repressor HrcA [Bryobacteraceae bacterium]